MANRLEDSLALLADNDTNNITAAILRQILTDTYGDAVISDDIIDDYTQTQGFNLALSAGRGADLNLRLAAAEQTIIDLEARIVALEP